jgi:hypothetical protein
MSEKIDVAAVLVLARAQGHGWVDEEVAGRIAAAATAAVQAVAASLPKDTTRLLSDPAADFIATLDALAEPAA